MSAQIEPPAIPKGDRNRPLLLLVGILCAPLVLVIVGFFIFRGSNASAVRRLEAKIRAAGEPLTLAELASTYGEIPNAENGAIPLMDAWAKDDPDLWEAFRAGRSALPQRVDRQFDEALPFLGSAAREIFRSDKLGETNLVAAEAYLSEQGERINRIRSALQYPRFHFPLEFARGSQMPLPHLYHIKQAVQDFRIIALCATERGDVPTALNALEEMTLASQVLAGESYIISQVLRMACHHFAQKGIERLLNHCQLTSAQLDQLARMLDQMNMQDEFRKTLITERVFMLDLFERPETVLGSSGQEKDENSASSASPLGGIYKTIGLAVVDRQLMLEAMSSAIAVADRDNADDRKQCEQILRDAGASAARIPKKVLTAVTLPIMAKAVVRFTSHEARRRLATIAVALERFRLAHDGLLPDGLDELVPKFLPQLPKDPFNDEPIQYKRLAVGYELYSVGENRVDDGGKERTKRALPGNYDETFFVER